MIQTLDKKYLNHEWYNKFFIKNLKRFICGFENIKFCVKTDLLLLLFLKIFEIALFQTFKGEQKMNFLNDNNSIIIRVKAFHTQISW